jgi:aspartyl-tRNA(Asn)/glutamyl-tRNA(Gln) amidotransferase subunit A
MLGTFALSSGYKNAYYEKALRVREMIREDFTRAFGKVDYLVSPTAPTTAFKLGEKSQDPLAMYLEDIYTVPVNLTGIPALSVNCGFDQAGLPIGLQLMGKPCADEALFAVAYLYEQIHQWSQSHEPSIV